MSPVKPAPDEIFATTSGGPRTFKKETTINDRQSDPINAEPTQKHFLQVMREVGFTDEQIEANRKHHGKLFLTPAVVLGWYRGFEVGTTINVITGDVNPMSGETKDLIALEAAFNKLLAKAIRQLDPDSEASRIAFQDFCQYIATEAEDTEEVYLSGGARDPNLCVRQHGQPGHYPGLSVTITNRRSLP